MSDNSLHILFIADIVGKPGMDVVAGLLPGLKKSHNIDLCIANGENADGGNGLTETLARQLFALGVDVITGGNHTWGNAQFRIYLDNTQKALRPLNYPPQAPGRGSTVVMTSRQIPVGVLNLQGRTFMYPIDCPFRTGHEEVARLREKTPIILVDFHAEATAEKAALAWYLDGSVSAIIGTHTHVQTADERILPKGTAFITDVGMTGPHDSVIGMDAQVAIKRFTTILPEKYRMASANIRLNGALIEVDVASGRARKISRINVP
ncbi:MAG TPA: TIGR00282 family metallophosphoesterase [bacterium]|nr:TIGR00282 family metallophosphoesterase [bacterium]HPR89233.1 TIGR00282 family metallophosphoesterase [bacterium]